MATSAKTILQGVIGTLNDDGNIRWSIQKLVRYLNDGEADIVVKRPDSSLKRETVSLVEGFQQSLPENGLKLIRINHNALSRNAVTQVATALMDAQMRGWRNASRSLDIAHYMYDPLEPRAFEVYPPALPGAALNVEFSAAPVPVPEASLNATIDSVNATLTIRDQFANALQNYILHRCYLEDTESAVTPSRHMQYYQAYFNELGIEFTATAGAAPKQVNTANKADSLPNNV